ncbi:MAG: hypothetical protein RR620_02175 [Clostridium sp.]
MSMALNKIFWGVILILLDFNLGVNGAGFDILPDFIGYIMIAKGFCMIQEYVDFEEYAKKGQQISYLLMGIDIIGIIISFMYTNINPVEISIWGGEQVVQQEPNFLMMIWGAVILVIGLLLDYYILKVIYIQGEKINNESLVKGSKNYFRFFSTIIAINLILTPFFINFNDVGFLTPLWVIFILVGFVVNVTYPFFIRNASKLSLQGFEEF